MVIKSKKRNYKRPRSRIEAKKRGFITKGFKHEYDSFKKMGTIAMFSRSARKRVGLESNKPELDDLKKLLINIEEEE